LHKNWGRLIVQNCTRLFDATQRATVLEAFNRSGFTGLTEYRRRFEVPSAEITFVIGGNECRLHAFSASGVRILKTELIPESLIKIWLACQNGRHGAIVPRRMGESVREENAAKNAGLGFNVSPFPPRAACNRRINIRKYG